MESTHVYASVHRQGSTQGVHAATWIPSTQVTDVRSDLDCRGEDEVADVLVRSAAQHRHADRQVEEAEEVGGSQAPIPQHGMASTCCMPRTADMQRWHTWGRGHCRTRHTRIKGHPAMFKLEHPRNPHARFIRITGPTDHPPLPLRIALPPAAAPIRSHMRRVWGTGRAQQAFASPAPPRRSERRTSPSASRRGTPDPREPSARLAS